MVRRDNGTSSSEGLQSEREAQASVVVSVQLVRTDVAAESLFAGTGDMRARARAFDWERTPLGAVSEWPAALRTGARLMMAAPVATCLWIGESHTLLYNDAYVPILGARHPRALGRSAADVWDELWPDYAVQLNRVRLGGEAEYVDAALLRMERLAVGQAEDPWFTFSLHALTDENADGSPGACLAVYNISVDVTGRARAAARSSAERARLAAIFEQSPSFFAVLCGDDNIFELANDACLAVVGKRDVLGKPLFEAVPEARGQGFDLDLARVRASGEPLVLHELPVQLRRTPGAGLEARYVNVTLMPLIESGVLSDAVVTHGTDVTDHVLARHEIERLLSASEQAREVAEHSEGQFRQMADAAPVLIRTADVDARCDWSTASWLALTGRPLADEVGRDWLDHVHPDDAAAARVTARAAFDAREPFVLEYRARRHDGEYRWLNESVAPRFNADGTFLGYVGTGTDNTAERTARATIDTAISELRVRAAEVVLANSQLITNALQLAAANEELRAVAEALGERTREAEQARVTADVARRRLRFLADASERFAGSLDYDETLKEVVALAAPAIADWASYSVDAGDGTVRIVAIHHQDPDREAFVRDLAQRYPIRMDEPAGAAHVLRTGETDLITDCPDSILEAVAQDAEHLRLLQSIGFRSVMTVPVVAQGVVIGALGFGTADSGRAFTVDDLACALELARRAAAAVENARLFREANRARLEAEAANHAKNQFLSTMSHELRTPLNAIGGYAELLSLGIRGPVTPAQQQDLERLTRANQHLIGLIGDVLNFARIEEGQVEYQITTFSINPILIDLEALIGPQLLVRGIEFDHDGCVSEASETPHLVVADAEKVRQIMLNLLSNAVKFTPHGGSVRLRCNTETKAGIVTLSVTDTGRGIPESQFERIFEPFVQVDRHLTHDSQQGVGLGLAISRDLARGMGGNLTVSIVEAEGSAFSLTLPCG